MSVPRLGFMDHFFCAFRALGSLRIPIRRHMGAFWGQCLERCLTEILEEDAPDAILTLDYDTIFTEQDVMRLIDLMRRHPEADAITTWQAARWRDTPLVTITDEKGKAKSEVERKEFEKELTRVATGHFGLTIFDAKKLAQLPHPWFFGQPDPETGIWNEKRIDDDGWFWRQWRKAGYSLYIANDVVVGHAELMICWPDINLSPIYQRVSDWWQKGKPDGVWRRCHDFVDSSSFGFPRLNPRSTRFFSFKIQRAGQRSAITVAGCPSLYIYKPHRFQGLTEFFLIPDREVYIIWVDLPAHQILFNRPIGAF